MSNIRVSLKRLKCPSSCIALATKISLCLQKDERTDYISVCFKYSPHLYGKKYNLHVPKYLFNGIYWY